jgi:DNA-binding NarL/FixJ family response regulator
VESSLLAARKERRSSRKQRAIRERREEVFRLLLRGLNQREIAEALGVSQPLINSDVKGSTERSKRSSA